MGQKEEQLPESIRLYVNRPQLRSELSDANTCYVITHGVSQNKILALVWLKPGTVGHFYPGLTSTRQSPTRPINNFFPFLSLTSEAFSARCMQVKSNMATSGLPAEF